MRSLSPFGRSEVFRRSLIAHGLLFEVGNTGGVLQVKTLHFGVANISRNKAVPDNAVAACAYRCGEHLRDAAGKLHRYGGRRGVLETAIFAPDAAPYWMNDDNQARAWERFGQEIERVENGHNKRASALLAKDFPAAAPRELTRAQNWAVAERFARQLTERGLAVAVAFHETDASDGGKNPHFHFLVPMRRVDRNGFDSKRYRTLDAPGKGKTNPELMALRREYFALVNAALEDAGVTGIYYDPEKQEGIEPGTHKGKAAWAVERKAVEQAKRERWAKVEDFLRPALVSLMETGETYQEGLGAGWWERTQAAALWQEEPKPLPVPVAAPGPAALGAASSWRDRMVKPSPAGRSR